MTDVLDEVQDLIGARPTTWGFVTWEDTDSDLYLRFHHRPSEDGPDGQPLTFEQLQTLDDEYGIVRVASFSDGATSSVMTVRVENL